MQVVPFSVHPGEKIPPCANSDVLARLLTSLNVLVVMLDVIHGAPMPWKQPFRIIQRFSISGNSREVMMSVAVLKNKTAQSKNDNSDCALLGWIKHLSNDK